MNKPGDQITHINGICLPTNSVTEYNTSSGKSLKYEHHLNRTTSSVFEKSSLFTLIFPF